MTSTNIDFHGTGTSGTVSLAPGAPRGDQFSFAEDVRLLGLRVFTAVDGGSGFTLTLWDMSGTKLAQGAVSAAVGAWATYTLPAPIVLTAGTKYLLTAYSSASRAGGTGSTSVHTHTVDAFTATYHGYYYAVGGDANTFPPNGPSTANEYGVGVVVTSLNTEPYAPTLTSLVGGEVIDRAATNRASHSFSDPDPGDSQSAFDHRYRLIGAPSWTEAYEPTPNGFVDYPAGTFAAGDYERQVRTYDSQGVPGPWSSSGFFTAADGPAQPTITDPIQNETIAAEARDVTWSAPSQDAYQLQVLDGGLVEHDTGTVVTTQRAAYAVPFPTNNVARSIRVRVRSGGLWSEWYSVAVNVSYTPPPVPSFTLTPSGTGLDVQVTNPAPGAGEPTVVQNDVLITEDGQEQRRAIVTPNGSWTYQTAKSGLDYDQLVRIEAIGDNGTRSSS